MKIEDLTEGKRKGTERSGKCIGIVVVAVAAAMMLAVFSPILFDGDDNFEDGVLGVENINVDISECEDPSAIRDTIQLEIDNSPSGTVTVIGYRAGLDHENIALSIPAGVTVIWKAVMTGEYQLNLTGSGIFEVTNGARLSSSNEADTIYAGGGNVQIIVSGGMVENTYYEYDENGGRGGDAIHFGPGGIIVTGGEITSNATGGHNGAIHGEIGAGAAYIRGGKIITTGDDGAAIHSNGDIIITGGLVRSTGNGSVTIHHGGAGFVAYLKGTVSGDIDSDGAVIEIDTLNITEDDIGTSNGITVRSGALLKENITWGPHSDDGDPVLIFPGGIEIQWYGSGPIDEGNGGSNMLLYVGIIVVIAIAAFAAYWFFLRPK